MAEETKEDFYEFAKLMYKDSKILFENESYHNSVYLGAFVLEGYIKILLIKNEISNYYAHINDHKLTLRINELREALFLSEAESSNLLFDSSDFYPKCIFYGCESQSKYSIHDRYNVNKWINLDYVNKVQDEIDDIYNSLLDLRIQGAVYADN